MWWLKRDKKSLYVKYTLHIGLSADYALAIKSLILCVCVCVYVCVCIYIYI